VNEIDAFVLVDTENCTSNLCSLLYLRAWHWRTSSLWDGIYMCQISCWWKEIPMLVPHIDCWMVKIVMCISNFLYFTHWHVVVILARPKMKQFNK